jgi:hypothetical protein
MSDRYRGPKSQLGKIRIKPGAVAELRKKIQDSFAVVVEELDYEYHVTIQDPDAFEYLGFFDQDIVDTGRFDDSQIIDVQTKGNVTTARWIWNPTSPDDGYHYASALYYGFHPYGGTGYCPGRPWVDFSIRKLDPVSLLVKELKSRGLKARVIQNNVSTLQLG